MMGRYTWRYLDRILGDKILVPPESTNSRGNFATACDVENRGETVVVGYRDGSLHLWVSLRHVTGSFNIQSGQYRGSGQIVAPVVVAEKKRQLQSGCKAGGIFQMPDY